MRYYLFLFFYLWTSTIFAQSLSGTISLLNSEGKTINGAEISISLVEQELQTRSDENGKFEFDLSNKVLGQQISLSVKKNGLEVVDPESLWLSSQQVSDKETSIVIQMAPRGTRKGRVEKYYTLASQLLETSASDSLLKTQLSEQEIGKLKVIAYDHLGTVVQRLAEFDSDQASEMAKEAFSAFENQQITEALKSLDDTQMAAALKNSSNGSIRGATEALSSPREQSIENYLLKARLSILSLKLKDAEAYYTRAIYADQDDFVKIAEFTRLLVSTKEYDKAAALCKKGFSVVRNDAQTLVILGLQSKVHLTKRAPKEAIQTLIEAQTIYQSLNAEIPQAYMADIAQAFKHLGLLQQHNGQYTEAVKAYLDAKKIYSDLILSLPKRYYEDIAQSFNYLADNYVQLGDVDKSVDAYKQLITWREKSLNDGGKKAATNYIRSRRFLAKNYLYFGIIDEAINLYEELAKDTSVDNSFERGQNYAGLAQAQYLSQKTKTAIVSSEQANKLLKANYQKSIEGAQAYTLSLNTLAFCHLRMHNYAKAIEAYNEAGPVLGSIQQLSSAKENLVIAISFQGMAKAYMGQFDLERAEKALQMAQSNLDVLNVNGELNSEQIDLYNTFADYYQLTYQHEKANEVLSKALALISTSEVGTHMPLTKKQHIIDTYLTSAKVNISTGNDQEAISSLSKAEGILEEGELWATQNARVLILKGEIALNQEKTENSRTLVQNAINILTPLSASKVAESQVLLFQAYLLHGKAFIDAQQYTTAQARLDAAESLVNEFIKNLIPSGSKQQCLLNITWADFYSAREEYGKAEEKLFAAIDYLEGADQQADKTLLAKAYYQLALLYHETKAKDESLNAFQKAENLSKDGQTNIDQKVLAKMYSSFANSLITWNQYEEALSTLRRAAEYYEETIRNGNQDKYTEQLAKTYTQMAWCSLILEQNEHAEAYTDAALVQSPEYIPAKLMQAHIWTVNGEFINAKKVYTAVAGQSFNGQKVKEICLDGLNSLEAAGVKSNSFQKVRALFR